MTNYENKLKDFEESQEAGEGYTPPVKKENGQGYEGFDDGFLCKQDSLFYEKYKTKLNESVTLQKYSVDIESKNPVFIEKKKEIVIIDEGDKITTNNNNKSLEEKVEVMLEIAKAKNWDLEKLEVVGEPKFVKEAKKQIAEKIQIQKTFKTQENQAKLKEMMANRQTPNQMREAQKQAITQVKEAQKQAQKQEKTKEPNEISR